MNAPTIVFDLDGTLVDSAPDLIETLNFVLRGEGITPLPFELARPMIGHGARVLLERGLDALGRTCPPADMDRMFKAYIEHYAGRIAHLTRPFPGLEGALDALSAQGCVLAVCTNKLEWLSVKLLDALGLTARFAAVCGQDSFGMAKPDPEILRRTIAKAGGQGIGTPPHEILLVIDGNTGQNALAQVKAFDEALQLTGLIVTKLDGTAKGGVLAAIALWASERSKAHPDRRAVPVYFIGVGEQVQDLETFNAREFAQALLS